MVSCSLGYLGFWSGRAKKQIASYSSLREPSDACHIGQSRYIKIKIKANNFLQSQWCLGNFWYCGSFCQVLIFYLVAWRGIVLHSGRFCKCLDQMCWSGGIQRVTEISSPRHLFPPVTSHMCRNCDPIYILTLLASWVGGVKFSFIFLIDFQGLTCNTGVEWLTYDATFTKHHPTFHLSTLLFNFSLSQILHIQAQVKQRYGDWEV